MDTTRKVLGCAAVEKIDEGFTVNKKQLKDEDKGDLVRGECKAEVVFGISRIWVNKSVRRSKIASNLVDVIRDNYKENKEEIPKDRIAFSQLTPDGKRFVLNYCPNEHLILY